MSVQYIGGTQPYQSAADLVKPAVATPAPQTTPTPQTPTAPTPSQTPQTAPQQTNGIDPSVVALMHGLKTAEGAVGNYTAVGDGGTAAGAGQWSNQFNGKVQPLAAGEIPNNFKGEAQKYGLDPNDFSPENQNKVLYAEISAGKAAGLTPEQILSAHNSGDPNKYLTAPTGNGQVGAYDVAGYVKRAMTAAQQYAQQNSPQNGSVISPLQPSGPTNAITGDTSSPSIGGFTGNIVKSGANLLGNLGEAVLHPIQTVQNIGGAAVGGLDELGGQTNDETAKFDNLKNYFVQRYGGVSNLESTMYQDPVGFIADLSTVLGGGAGALGLAGKGAEIAGAAGAASKIADVGNALGKASELTNPLTPVVAGTGALLNKGAGVGGFIASQATGLDRSTIAQIITNPESFTADQIANASRAGIAHDIETALQNKETELSDTGKSYSPYRETPSPIETAPDYLDNAFREGAGVEVKDGVITPTSGSLVRNTADINKLQQIYNLYKPDFLNGTMDSNKFLNLRSDLAEKANFGNGLTKNLERAAAGIRDDLNKTYRTQVPGLDAKDELYSAQKPEFDKLRKGILDKEGNLQESAINKIANAGGKGKDLFLEKLEQIEPGITKRLQIQKAIEDIERSGENKVGTYARALEPGGALVALATGHIGIAAGALTALILSNPSAAVKILSVFGKNKELISAVISKLAQAANMSTVANRASGSAIQPQDQKSTEALRPTTGSTDTQSNTTTGNQLENSSSIESLASNKGFDLSGARAAGYSDADIIGFLEGK